MWSFSKPCKQSIITHGMSNNTTSRHHIITASLITHSSLFSAPACHYCKHSSLIHSLTHSFTHSFTHLLTRLCTSFSSLWFSTEEAESGSDREKDALPSLPPPLLLLLTVQPIRSCEIRPYLTRSLTYSLHSVRVVWWCVAWCDEVSVDAPSSWHVE
jgi:hypothetical protein